MKILLDLASGPGQPAMALAEAFPRAEVISSDVSEDMVEAASAKAKAQGLRNLKAVVADAQVTAYFHTHFSSRSLRPLPLEALCCNCPSFACSNAEITCFWSRPCASAFVDFVRTSRSTLKGASTWSPAATATCQWQHDGRGRGILDTAPVSASGFPQTRDWLFARPTACSGPAVCSWPPRGTGEGALGDIAAVLSAACIALSVRSCFFCDLMQRGHPQNFA